MPDTITLKNKANANVVYNKVQQVGAKSIFVHSGGSLLERARVELRLNEGKQANHVVGKLLIPTKQDNSSCCGPDGVAYTEAGEFRLTSVLIAAADDADDFIAQFSSLVGSALVKSMYVNGASA